MAVVRHFSQGLPDVTRIKAYEPSQTTRIYASGGELIATLFIENRTFTPLEDMAPAMRDAIVAVEDSRFREHIGVDPRGVIRAAVYDLQHKGAHQGASTITMQLARNLFLTPTRSLERKIREALLSVEIERHFTKDEILELYLNQIYFGSGAYGIGSASSIYFDKKPSELTISESALLAGLPQAPSDFSPFVDERAAKHRQILVLGRMRETNAITQAEYQQALEETKGFVFQDKPHIEFEMLKLPYFTTYALQQLSAKYPDELLYRGGLTIHTTLDVALQKRCEGILAEMIAKDGKALGADTGAIVVIENKTGYVRALVGGTGWSDESQFNRAWQAQRQPGSSFKPIVFAAALEKGRTPDSEIEDTPLTVRLGPDEVWIPKNSDRAYMGKITLSDALKYSRNVAAVRLGQEVGIEEVVKLARKMGIQESLPPHPSVALGAVEVTPLDLAAVYTVFPNDGIGVDVNVIKRVVDGTEEAIEEHTFANRRDILSPQTARAMVAMMKGVVEDGTAQKATLDSHEAAGKTGTTDSFRDAWFVGFTNDYTTAVWVGRDDNAQMKKSFGGDLPARIWKRVMTAALENRPPSKFFLESLATRSPRDEGSQDRLEELDVPVREAAPRIILTVCKQTRLRAQPGCPALVKVEVENTDQVDWCPNHEEDAPLASDWREREPVQVSRQLESREQHSGWDAPNSNTDLHDRDPLLDDMRERPARNTGGLDTVESVRGIDSVNPVTPVTGRDRSGSSAGAASSQIQSGEL